jgi:hypothetical protein
MIWGKGADLDGNAGPSKVMITMTQCGQHQAWHRRNRLTAQPRLTKWCGIECQLPFPTGIAATGEGNDGLGHEDPFPRQMLNGWCRFGQGTFAGAHGNERDAPIADLPALNQALSSVDPTPIGYSAVHPQNRPKLVSRSGMCRRPARLLHASGWAAPLRKWQATPRACASGLRGRPRNSARLR